jgi:hypothetical protein
MKDRRPEPTMRLKTALRHIGVLARSPTEGIERLRYKIEIFREVRSSAGGHFYPINARWEETLHDWVGIKWPCEVWAEFDHVYGKIQEGLSASDEWVPTWDADAALARAIWCEVRHLRPANIVETGVARGVTSRLILEALERNGTGHLWSIDLPPLKDPWRSQVGVAVPSSLRKRWTYLEGSSRRLLPPLLQRLNTVEAFIHDSLHTEANLKFELHTAWRALAPGGLLLSDDVGENRAFEGFLNATSAQQWLVASQESKSGMFGVVRKPDTLEGQASQEP